jgi:hypothetical protein
MEHEDLLPSSREPANCTYPVTQCFLVSFYFLPLASNILFGTLSTKVFLLLFFLIGRDKVSYPYSVTDKLINYIFLSLHF